MNEDDLQFQDYAMQLLYKAGMPICIYGSKKYQIKVGESIGRVEIKHDKKMKNKEGNWGNVFIEYAERHDPEKPFVYSGILRDDNTLFYMIGDYERTFLLGKFQLISIISNEQFEKKETQTSLGVVVPIKYLEQHKPVILNEWENGNEKKNFKISQIRERQIFNIQR